MRCKDTAHNIVSVVPRPWDGCVVEIGPGTGSLTKLLLQREDISKVIGIEIEKDSCELLRTMFSSHENFSVIEQDFLCTKDPHFWGLDPGYNNIFIGNLPYNRAAQMIFHCLEVLFPHVYQMIFTVQWEVALRFASKVGSNHYSKASVGAQFFCETIELVGEKLSPQLFWPVPKVHSQTIVLTPKKIYPTDVPYQTFRQIVRGGFGWRRKQFGQALFCACKTTDLEEEKVDQLLNLYPEIRKKRGEELSYETYLEIARKYEQIRTN